ncbi:MAG: FtsX-like permease family protein [Candidatus Bathyarchaeia archaeon]
MRVFRLLGFRYLRVRAAIIVVVVSVSMLSTTTATILNGFYKCYTGYLGEAADIVALYDSGSSTPFTGLIPSRLADYISSIDGVLAFSMEVLAPCMIYDKPMIARGVYMDDFLKLTSIDIIYGSIPSLDSYPYALAGFRAASRLGIRPGVKLLVLGVLSDRYCEVRVEAVYRSDTALDDELIVPIDVGRWLRGIGYDYATLFRVRIDGSRLSLEGFTDRLASMIGVVDGSDRSESKPPRYTYISTSIGSIGISTIRGFMERYIESYGLTWWTITLLSLSTIIFSSLTVIVAFKILVEEHRFELSILRSLGLSMLDVRIDVFLKIMPYIVLSSLIGSILALALVELMEYYDTLRILSYTVSVSFDPIILLASIVSNMILAMISIAWGRMG